MTAGARLEQPRILLVTSDSHGHRTYRSALASAFAERESPLDQHVVRRDLLNRAFAARIPRLRGADLYAVRRLQFTRLQLHRTARRALSSYDLVHVMPSGLALAFGAVRRPGGGAVLSVGLDSTALLRHAEFGTNWVNDAWCGRLERRLFERTDHVVALSEWALRSVRHMTPSIRHHDIVPPSAPIGPPPSASRPRRAGTPGVRRLSVAAQGWRPPPGLVSGPLASTGRAARRLPGRSGGRRLGARRHPARTDEPDRADPLVPPDVRSLRSADPP